MLLDSLRYANIANLTSTWLPRSDPIRHPWVEIYGCLHTHSEYSCGTANLNLVYSFTMTLICACLSFLVILDQ
jgi:hypothetical protein